MVRLAAIEAGPRVWREGRTGEAARFNSGFVVCVQGMRRGCIGAIFVIVLVAREGNSRASDPQMRYRTKGSRAGQLGVTWTDLRLQSVEQTLYYLHPGSKPCLRKRCHLHRLHRWQLKLPVLSSLYAFSSSARPHGSEHRGHCRAAREGIMTRAFGQIRYGTGQGFAARIVSHLTRRYYYPEL
jgi:hypothetical protein